MNTFYHTESGAIVDTGISNLTDSVHLFCFLFAKEGSRKTIKGLRVLP